MKIIGLTGGIASGKSFVSQIFAELGAYIVDADEIYHYLLKSEEMKNIIKEAFGVEFFDKNGELDRKKLGRLVFSDKDSLTKLNSISHPLVRRDIRNALNLLKKKESTDPETLIAIVVVPLLFEFGFYTEVDETVVVTVDRETQINRLCSRSSLSKEDAVKRIDAQMLLSEKEKLADYVIDNKKSKTITRKQVEQLFTKLRL